MKRHLPLLLTLLFCIPIWLARASTPSLLTDSDTSVLLTAIRARNAPLSWFAGDWPLGNHFYRPVSTLSFELDDRIWGTNAAGYGATQALLAIGCALALFWFVRELVNPNFGCVAASLFALWNLDQGASLSFFVPYLAGIVFLMAVVRRLGLPVWRGDISNLQS